MRRGQTWPGWGRTSLIKDAKLAWVPRSASVPIAVQTLRLTIVSENVWLYDPLYANSDQMSFH